MVRVFLLVVILLGNIVFAQDTQRPLWEENCPNGLHDAVYRELKWYWPAQTKDTQSLYNYWAQRHEEFEDALFRCDFLSSEFRSACYANVKAKQATDNEVYKSQIEQKKITSQIWKDTNKMTNPVMFNLFSK